MKKEIWKDIKGFEGLYQISNKGNIRGFSFLKNKKPMVLKKSDNGKGYDIVQLHKGKTRKNFYVHRLVAEHFIKPIPAGYVVNHLDYNKKNNSVENLEIVTQKQNIEYSRHRMKKPHQKGDLFYICHRPSGYEVTINKKYIGRFKSIEEAKERRNKYLEEINYY